MSDWNKELPDFKEKRRDTENLRPVAKGKKTPRQWRVFGMRLGKDRLLHKAATKEAAEAWIEKQARTYYTGRYMTPAMVDEAKKRAISRAENYRVVPPNTKITGQQGPVHR